MPLDHASTVAMRVATDSLVPTGATQMEPSAPSTYTEPLPSTATALPKGGDGRPLTVGCTSPILDTLTMRDELEVMTSRMRSVPAPSTTSECASVRPAEALTTPTTLPLAAMNMTTSVGEPSGTPYRLPLGSVATVVHTSGLSVVTRPSAATCTMPVPSETKAASAPPFVGVASTGVTPPLEMLAASVDIAPDAASTCTTLRV
mmetsp:Transcript_25153/g.87758  ORF Transcript_25153/g.87758 Transcript_25153/m.87758 type:complete len:203 (+) Transcript_25153:218-826(+)